MRLVLAFFLILLEAHQTWSVNFGLYPYVEILVADRKTDWFDDKSGPVAKWIRRRFPTPEIAGSSPARVDQNFSTFHKYTFSLILNWKQYFLPFD